VKIFYLFTLTYAIIFDVSKKGFKVGLNFKWDDKKAKSNLLKHKISFEEASTAFGHEYNFSNGIRGKYSQQYKEGVNIIKLDNDVRKIFPDAQSINNALRTLINLIPKNQTNKVQVEKHA